jgi:hypothetical protein
MFHYVPAQPGWYEVSMLNDGTIAERHPVIAWKIMEDGTVEHVAWNGKGQLHPMDELHVLVAPDGTVCDTKGYSRGKDTLEEYRAWLAESAERARHESPGAALTVSRRAAAIAN